MTTRLPLKLYFRFAPKMNVVRNSTGTFDADRLLSKTVRPSMTGVGGSFSQISEGTCI